MSEEQVEQAVRAAHLEAAPAAALAAGLDVALAVASALRGWHLFAAGDWWIWVPLALPAALVAVVFWFGMANLGVSRANTRNVTDRAPGARRSGEPRSGSSS